MRQARRVHAVGTYLGFYVGKGRKSNDPPCRLSPKNIKKNVSVTYLYYNISKYKAFNVESLKSQSLQPEALHLSVPGPRLVPCASTLLTLYMVVL